MPRRSQSSGSKRSSYFSRRAAVQQKPMPIYSKPIAEMPRPSITTRQQQGGMFSGLGNTLMTGMAFGAGSEIAHQSIRSIIGGNTHYPMETINQQQSDQQKQEKSQNQKCFDETFNFTKCLENNNEIQHCQVQLDMLKECQKNLQNQKN